MHYDSFDDNSVVLLGENTLLLNWTSFDGGEEKKQQTFVEKNKNWINL